ncbi:hypothetical protein ONZ45_g17548 [Pleurotus djamor]|nr:hypothetical protein ONZ45_g17548 [Pleurotus djamor]
MSNDTFALLVLGASACLIASRLVKQAAWKQSSLPPGPPGDPIIGNLRHMPTENIQVVFHEWAKKICDEAAVDLLDKRSQLYSDRPPIIVYTIMGWVQDLALMRYGEEWRYHRKLVHSHFTQSASRTYEPIQLKNVYILAQSLLKNNGHFNASLSRFSTAIILEISYGHQIQMEGDEYIELAEASGTALRSGGPLGGTVVDFFPFLQYLPSWFPGTHFANIAREFKGAVNNLYRIPFERALEAIREGKAADSFVSRCVAARGGALSPSDTAALQGASAHLYAAGAETTWSTLVTFILAMLLHPECQRLGQEEVDRVVGKDRLPSFEDRDSLPYVNAVVEETLRWYPAVPLGLPHAVTHDDSYRGMFIPKGSFIFANALGVSRNANVYENPEVFNPMRFLPKSQGGNEEPPFNAAFGICPGRHLATSSVFIAVATIFSALHISKSKGEDGKEITPEVEYVTGVTSHPKPFVCDLSSRNEATRKLVDEAVDAVGEY